MTEGRKNWYDNNYKWLLLFPVILLILSVGYLINFSSQHGDIIYKDISLTGGTTLSVFDEKVDIRELGEKLREKFPDLRTREISDFRTGKQKGFFVETKAESDDIKKVVEDYLGYTLTQENSSVEFSGSTLSQGFYSQLKFAIVLAFVFMSLVVFFTFRTFIPSLAVILSAFADIVMTVALVDILGMQLSVAGVIAFLMLIGYSVDTDILLTTRLLKQRDEELNKRIFGAFKTGITMTLTSIAAVGVALIIIYSFSETLRQIFSILLIGLGFDLVNTWFTNAGILKMYMERRSK
mgnify:CR=1 FL=1